ncbi:MAG: hypothetical protein ACLFR1_00110 [Spirochaetia bacterium]
MKPYILLFLFLPAMVFAQIQVESLLDQLSLSNLPENSESEFISSVYLSPEARRTVNTQRRVTTDSRQSRIVVSSSSFNSTTVVNSNFRLVSYTRYHYAQEFQEASEYRRLEVERTRINNSRSEYATTEYRTNGREQENTQRQPNNFFHAVELEHLLLAMGREGITEAVLLKVGEGGPSGGARIEYIPQWTFDQAPEEYDYPEFFEELAGRELICYRMSFRGLASLVMGDAFYFIYDPDDLSDMLAYWGGPPEKSDYHLRIQE